MASSAPNSARSRSAVLRVGVIAAWILIALAPRGGRAIFAHEAQRPTTATLAPIAEGVVELEGTLEILHEDGPGGSRYHHVLSTDDGKRWSVEGVQHGQDLLTGDRVRVRGTRFEKAAALPAAGIGSGAQDSVSIGSGASGLQVLSWAPLPNTFGPQRTAVILVNFSNNRSQAATIEFVQSVMTASDQFFRENSYQQTSLSTDIFGWYTLPITNLTCAVSSIQAYAKAAATAAGVNLLQYGRHVFIFPQIASCGFLGMATIGGNPAAAWINGAPDVGTVSHELGHTFGLYHSHSLFCQGVSLGGSCASSDYGDEFDTMGRGYGHFNASQKWRLGWLDYGVSPPVTTVQTSGTYTIDAYEGTGLNPKALRILRGATGQSFFVELRRNTGWDTYLYRTGVLVHLATDVDPDSSYLLDMRPETLSFSDDAFLDVGKSFTDPIGGITLTTLSVSDSNATLMVDINSPCVASSPTITASPGQSLDVQSGTPVTYNVSITNTDSAGCSPSTFALQATSPAGWQTSFGAPSLIVSPGGTASTTLKVTSPATPPGAYNIVCTVSHGLPPALPASASVVYVVAAPPSGGGGTGSFTDTFDRPDSPTLGNGWSVIKGGLMIQAGQARNQASQLASVAVQPGISSAAQTVEASFASTNNNSAPRFGVVMRYVDPRNYYVCYRQVGGSSVVRIAKMQNGVETVLKSVGVGNPALNVFSTLSCQASGSALTLRLDGITKLSATDGSFGTGAVGWSISSSAGASHRAENFTAVLQ